MGAREGYKIWIARPGAWLDQTRLARLPSYHYFPLSTKMSTTFPFFIRQNLFSLLISHALNPSSPLLPLFWLSSYPFLTSCPSHILFCPSFFQTSLPNAFLPYTVVPCQHLPYSTLLLHFFFFFSHCTLYYSYYLLQRLLLLSHFAPGPFLFHFLPSPCRKFLLVFLFGSSSNSLSLFWCKLYKSSRKGGTWGSESIGSVARRNPLRGSDPRWQPHGIASLLASLVNSRRPVRNNVGEVS